MTVRRTQAASLTDLPATGDAESVYLFLRPDLSADFTSLVAWAKCLPERSVVCVLTTPQAAARLLPALQEHLTYQLWIAVKSEPIVPPTPFALPQTHLALLVLTRYKGSLRHTKTRIGYTYCPACGKTTKDYGGKKHTYHEYGTLMADVWRDLRLTAAKGVTPVIDRLKDLFGLPPYRTIEVFDFPEQGIAVGGQSSVENSLIVNQPLAADHSLTSALINDDCLNALAQIPNDSVDFCFADPPYNLQKKYDRWDDALETKNYFAWCDQWLSELAQVLKPGRTLAVLNIPLWAVRHFQHLRHDLVFQNWIVWEALGFPVRQIMPAHYAILCVSKGTPRELPGLNPAGVAAEERAFLAPMAENYCLRGTCVAARRRGGVNDRDSLTDLWADVHRLKHNSRRVDHPCQLPPLLMQRLYATFTRPGETILDCFNGAGTSTLVAHQMGRRYLGIELSAQYHALANERHRRIEAGEDPFAKQKPDHVPTAKNSRVGRLRKQRYAVPKKRLQLEIKRIAQELGRLPSREEVAVRTAYPMEYFDGSFASWGEACAAARTTGMSERPPAHQEAQLRLVLERRETFSAASQG